MTILFIKIQKILQIFYVKYKKPVLGMVLILLISCLGIFVFDVGEARAIDLGIYDSLKSTIGSLFLTIFNLIGKFIALLANLAQGILDYSKLQNAPIVERGWNITRDLVNMFFVLVLLVIALATILRIETYGMKQILWKLIVAALLINFSLVFCGVIIDFAGVLTDFFIDDSKTFFEDIAKNMQLLEIQKTSAEESWQRCTNQDSTNCAGSFTTQQACKDSIKKLWIQDHTCSKIEGVDWANMKGDRFWEVIGSLILSILFAIVAVFVFGALAFLLLIRVLAIWFLLILAPIAWFFWILPATKEHFTKWWSAFIKWVFFAPAAIFFIWLSVECWKTGLSPSGEIASTMVKSSDVLTPQVMQPSILVQFLLACGMLIGSLIVAQKMGIAGAEGTIKLGKGISKGIGRWSGRLGMRAGLKMAPPPQKQPDGRIKGGWIQRGLAQAAKIPIAGKLITPAIRGLEKTRAVVEKQKESIKGWSSQHSVDTFDRSNAEGKVARMMQLHENNDLNMLNTKQLKKGLKLAQRYGQESKLVKAMPSYAGDIGKSVQDIINKINPEAASKIVSNQIDDEKVQNAIVEALRNGQWTSAHLSRIANDNPELRVSIQRKIITKENVKRFAPPTKDYLKSYLGNALYDTPPEWLESETPEVEFSTA